MSLTFSHFTLDNESINSHLAIISIPVAASLSNEVTAHWINVKHLEDFTRTMFTWIQRSVVDSSVSTPGGTSLN